MLCLPKNEFRISITSACNMKCAYCHNEGNKSINQLSLGDIELLIKESYDLGLEQVRLTGGEPLVHKQIFDICQMLSESYGLKVGINTNLIEIDKLLYMIKKGWIYRVVVGLDYFNNIISKQSTIGVSSTKVLNNIIKIKKTGCNVNISTVYNGDYDNIFNLASWCIKNEIRLKILEPVINEISSLSDSNYIKMRDKLLNELNLEIKLDSEYKEVQGVINEKNVITFFHSHCRLRECDLCKQMHLRVTSTGKLKTCLHYDEEDIDYRIGNVHDNIVKVLKRSVNYHNDNKVKEK